MIRVFGLLLLVTLLALTGSQAQGSLSFSGTVLAAPNSSLQNTVVIACLLVNDECSDSRSKFVQINSTQKSAPFTLGGLENAEFLLLAWRDINKDGEVSKGDELSIYSVAGKPKLLKPPLAKLELKLNKFSGDIDALLSQVTSDKPVAQVSPVKPAPQNVPLSLTGQVLPQAGSSLSNTQVFACFVQNDRCDPSRSKGVRTEPNGGFSIQNLENVAYGLFAWQDTDGNANVSLGDDIAVYLKAGQVSSIKPPASGIALQLKNTDLNDFNAMLDLFLPATVTPPSNSNQELLFSLPKDWRDTGNGNYEADFNSEGYLFDANSPGKLYMTIYPSEAKNGTLTAQARSIWQRQTKGTLDHDGKSNGVFIRRLSSGLNTAVTTGSAGEFSFENGTKTWVYSVMFLVETGSRVTPIFFKLERPKVGIGYLSTIYVGRPLVLKFMASLKAAKTTSPAAIYSEKEILGKWKISSNTYNSTDYYNVNTGAYSSTSWTASGFTSRLTFQSGGVGRYFSELVTITNGNSRVSTENVASKWRIVGDALIVERPSTGFTAVYQLYGMAKDEKGQPIILSRYLGSNPNQRDDIDGTPKDIWVVDK